MTFQLFVAFALVMSVTAQNSCWSCTGSVYYSAPYVKNDCFDAAASTTNLTCASGSYCLTTFTLQDGLPSAVMRACADPASDYDASTSSAPSVNHCVTSLNQGPNPTESTVCYFPCSGTDNCNTQDTITVILTCASNCSTVTGGGYCDYISGSCVCNTGFSGSNCATTVTTTPTYRSCVQCNGETDLACSTTTTSTQCPGDTSVYNYCASTQTRMIDPNGNLLRTIVSRGCTNSYTHNDECFITNAADIYTANIDYTCTTTCDTDGCNTGLPDGLLSSTESKGLYCVVCDDPTGAGTCNTVTNRELCPSGSTYCFHNTSYLISDKADLHYASEPEYKLGSVHRGCGSTALTTGCTSTAVAATSLMNVTCLESCQEDGCNVGWPARPTCSSCVTDSASDIKDGYDSCLNNPPEPTQCAMPYHAYCTFRDYQKDFARTGPRDGYTRFIMRGCSYYNNPSQCVTSLFSVENGVTLRNCNYTCTTDGCNQGINGSHRLVQGFLTVTLPAILGLLFQQMFSP